MNMKEELLTKSELVGQAYINYANEVMSLFRQYNICEEDAEDLVQEVFMKVLCVDTLCTETLKGLVMVAAFNMRNDYFRRKAFRRKALEKMPEIDELSCACMAKVESDNIVELETAIARESLNEINFKVYSMSRHEELSSTEIAELLNLEVRTVESRLYYSRKVVRRRLSCAL